MPEIKSLGDFYNPTQIGQLAMTMQHLGLQQQQMGMQQQAQAAQAKNTEIDNLQQALKTANPMESYPIANKLAQLRGTPMPDVNTYYANVPKYNALLNSAPGTPENDAAIKDWLQGTPESRAVVEKAVNSQRAFAGAQEANVKAGLGGSENLAQFTADNPAVQTQVMDAVAQSPKQQLEAQALQSKVDEHNDLSTYVNTQLGALVPVKGAADLAIGRTEPIMQSISAMQAQYDKNVKSLGVTKAAQIRQEQMKLNPDLQQWDQRGQQSIPQMQQLVQQIEDGQSALQTRAELIASGVHPLQDGESLHVLAGKIDASQQHLAYAKAQLAFAKDRTPANFEALKTVKQGLDSHLTRLTETKNASQDALAVRHDAQLETARKNKASETVQSDEAEAQQRYAALPTAQQSPQGAARIAAQMKQETGRPVSTKTIMEGAKLPNTSPVSITMGQEKQEAATVGTGFGKAYIELQDAVQSSSGTLNKLNRMETLMQGIETGKLTPALTQIQAVAEALGIQVDKSLPAKQAIDSMANELALTLRNPSGGAGMPGALSDKDREFLTAMTPGLSKTPGGNALIIQTGKALAQRNIEVAKLARGYRKKHGQFDEGFYDELAVYAEKHPLFTGNTLPQAAPSASAVTGKSDYDALPSGSIYTAPDGSQRRKK